MSEEHRLTVYAKLASDVLGAVAEGSLPLSSGSGGTAVSGGGYSSLLQIGTTELLLSETLMLLSSAPLRMSTGASKRGTGAPDDDEEAGMDGAAEGGGAVPEGAVHASVAAAKTRLLRRLLKRQVSEQVLPVVLGLRQVLQAHQSAVMGPLTGYIKTLFEDFGDELQGALRPAPVIVVCQVV